MKKYCLNGGTLSLLRQSRINALKVYNSFLSRFNLLAIFCTSSSPTDTGLPTSSTNLENSLSSIDLFSSYGPGLYQIVCKVNNKRYIGESSNVLARAGRHTRDLEKGVSDCYPLQKDWLLYGPSQFDFNPLLIGPEWVVHEARLKKEAELICSYTSEEVYNNHPLKSTPLEENYRLVCKIHGKQYKSVGDASRETGEKDTRIRAKLYNNYPGYEIIGKVKHGYEAIIVNGKEYSSINNAVAASEAKTRFQAMQRLKSKSPKYKNWNYVSLTKRIAK